MQRNGIGGGAACQTIGLPHDLSHFQTAPGQRQGAEVAPMVAAGVLVNPRRAAEFAGDDE